MPWQSLGREEISKGAKQLLLPLLIPPCPLGRLQPPLWPPCEPPSNTPTPLEPPFPAQPWPLQAGGRLCLLCILTRSYRYTNTQILKYDCEILLSQIQMQNTKYSKTHKYIRRLPSACSVFPRGRTPTQCTGEMDFYDRRTIKKKFNMFGLRGGRVKIFKVLSS